MSSKTVIQPSLRRIVRPRTHIHQPCRNFTSTPRSSSQNNSQNSMTRAMVGRQMSREKAMSSKMSNARSSDIPNDLGIVPDTLIKPDSKDLPSLLSTQVLRRLRIEWSSRFQRLRDFINLIYELKWNVRRDTRTRKRITEDLELIDRYHHVPNLHTQLYRALASGDRETIGTISCIGLNKALKNRLDQRRAVNGPQESWIVKYKGINMDKIPNGRVRRFFTWAFVALLPPQLKGVRILADRYVTLPMGKNSRLRQVIAKVKSTQTLDKGDGKGPRTRDREELVVIQQMIMDGKRGDWMIWGTTQPSTKEQIDELFDSQKKSPGMMDMLQSQMKV